MLKVNNKYTRTSPLAIVNFEQVNAGWDSYVIYNKISHYDRIIKVNNLLKQQQQKKKNILKMKQKDNSDILYETRFMNIYLTEPARTLFWLPHFYDTIENF